MYNDEDIRQLILDMVDEETVEYSKAYNVIYKTTDKRFLSFALKLLESDNDSEVTAALNVIRSAERVHSSEYLPQILPFLDRPSHCVDALRVIRCIGNSSVFPRLLAFLIYPDSEARVRALSALYNLKHPQFFEICLHLANDSDVNLRNYACAFLGESGNPLVIDLLIEKLGDEEIGEKGAVNSAAAWALGRLKAKQAVEALKNTVLYGSEEASRSALGALWEIEGNSLELFYFQQVKHHYFGTKREAIEILGRLGKEDYIDLLISVSQNDCGYDIQYVAAYALRTIGTPEALKAYEHWNNHYKRNT